MASSRHERMFRREGFTRLRSFLRQGPQLNNLPPADGLRHDRAMSRFAEVIVLARNAEQIMEPLTCPDDTRGWYQCFTRIDDSLFEGTRTGSAECYAWVIQFLRPTWAGLLGTLEALHWPDPGSVQVLIRDEEDSCFGLWMMYEERLVEVPLPHTRRTSYRDSVTGVLTRTEVR
jgi:hypothetical protein